jgi:hypothetical protein
MLLAGMWNWLGKPSAADAASVSAALGLTADAPPPAATPDGEPAWSAARIEVAGQLWGEGFVFPGGEEETLRLARPLCLSAASSLLLLGCGPGGPARSVATRFGVWVSGFEADAHLAAAGAMLCARAGLGRRAQVETWDPAHPRFAPRYYHHALLLDAIRGSAPESVLGALVLSLRPGGQVTLAQTVVEAPLDPADPHVARWAELEGRSPDLPTEAAISRILARLGFDIRVVEDISQRHMIETVRGWHTAVRAMQTDKPRAARAALLVREAELWLLRIRLIRASQLRLVRWHAISRPQQ